MSYQGLQEFNDAIEASGPDAEGEDADSAVGFDE